MSEPSAPVYIAMLVTPHFNAAATTGFLDPFRAANYLRGQTLFQWDLWSETGGPCPASNGMSVDTKPLSDLPDLAGCLLVVSSSWTPEAYATASVLSAVRHGSRAGSMVAALDTGAFILARAGVLKGRSATCHYEHIDAFAEKFPDVDLREDLMVFDRNYATCAGGSASLDFGLILLQQMHGDTLANAAAKYLCHNSIRHPGTRQADTSSEPLGPTAPLKLHLAIDVMERNLENPLPIPDICQRAGISQRQLDRLFQSHVRATPAQYYRDIRLDRARGLVTQTRMSITQVAQASGFGSQDHFARAYKARFGLPPSRDRIEGRVPFEFRAWPMYKTAP